MSKRLISLKQIQAEKIKRSKSWLWGEMAVGNFPKPLPGTNPGLWEEEQVDLYVEAFIAKSKARQDARKEVGRKLLLARQRKDSLAAAAA